MKYPQSHIMMLFGKILINSGLTLHVIKSLMPDKMQAITDKLLKRLDGLPWF